MSHHDNHNVQFEIAEVIEINNAFKWNKTIAGQASAHMVKARSCTTYTDVYEMHVVPISNRTITIPLIGEIILIFRTVNKVAKQKVDKAESWYYLQTLDLQGAINNNRSTGMTFDSQEIAKNDPQYIPAGTNFEDSIISPLQPYEGDSLLQGRFGNSIRFGSTISTIPDDDYYHKPPNWSGDINSDPIIILSNGQTNLPNKEFVVENVETDKSSLYLTSTQRIPIVLGSQENPNSLTGTLSSRGHESKYQDSQLLAVSDRIILKARTDLAVIDSPIGIILNSTGNIKLGSDDAAESMVHGEVLLEILTLIIDQFTKSVGKRFYFKQEGSPAQDAQKLLNQLLSSTYKMKKNINK